MKAYDPITTLNILQHFVRQIESELNNLRRHGNLSSNIDKKIHELVIETINLERNINEVEAYVYVEMKENK